MLFFNVTSISFCASGTTNQRLLINGNICFKKSLVTFIFISICFLLLNACGGGGGATSPVLSIAPSTPFSGGGSSTYTPPASCGTNCSGKLPAETSQNVWTVENPSCECVNYAISKANPGATINVMAGSGSVQWPANAVIIPANKPVNLLGPGSHQLTIKLGGNYIIKVAAYIGTRELPATRISGFKFLSPLLDSKYGAIFFQGQGWRIDHCAYESIDSEMSATTGVFVTTSGLNTTIQPYGLVDNNIIINGKIANTGMGSFTNMCAAWADDLRLGSNEAVYVEDNRFSSNTTYRKLVMDANRGGKYVFRYNTTTKSWVLAHGLQADQERGTRKWEIYGNIFQNAGGGSRVATQMKGGTGVIFNNDITSPTDPWNSGVDLYHERDIAHPLMPMARICNGTSGWDKNTPGLHGWLCRDQVGADKDASQWASPPQNNLPGPVQTKTSAYFWSVIDGATIKAATKMNNQAVTVIKNRDYYDHTSSFNGTSGVGCGTLTNRPATCTTGVAYWSTNQSCTDMSGMVGAHPSTPIEGTLYKCTNTNPTNPWAVYYTPYTYPHPLRK